MSLQENYRVIGLMSGTSMDGVDAALIETDGEGYVKREYFTYTSYHGDTRDALRRVLGRTQHDSDTKKAEYLVTEIHAKAVGRLLAETGYMPADIDLIGFHGQTITHAPTEGLTWQLGDGAHLARRTGIRVINDFRTADVKAGGQGAPLVPVYHRARVSGMEKPLVVLNIGGVANVTYVGEGDDLIAFDTGPGNALLDDWVLQCTGYAQDTEGRLAQRGTVDENILQQLLAHDYFGRPVPKSLDRNDFVSRLCESLKPEDGAATLTAFTVQSITKALDHFPQAPKQWLVSGGGRHNAYMMQQLSDTLNASVKNVDDLGWNGDAVEAEAFAYLAVRRVKDLPITFPGTTGVQEPLTGGRLCG